MSKHDTMLIPVQHRIAAAVFFLFVGYQVTAMAATVIGSRTVCKAQPTAQQLFVSPWAIWSRAGAAACLAGRDASIIAFVLLSALVVVIFALLFWWLRRYRESDRYKLMLWSSREGLATKRQLRTRLSEKARLKNDARLRPSLRSPKIEQIAVKVGTSRDTSVYLSVEDSVALEGAPRSGKGFYLIINTILDWAGPLITTSTRNDNLTATWAARAKRGEVSVFDPQGLSGITATKRISPITGCTDPLTATSRAAAIMGGTALGASATNAEWAQEAESILARLLMAADLAGHPVSTLGRWGADPTAARAAVPILEQEGPAGWGDSLAATLDTDPRLLQSRWMGVAAATRPLLQPSVCETMTPRHDGEVFDVEQFLSGENTLYLIGTRTGAAASGGFLGAVLDDIVTQARRRALQSRGGRLDPPLGLVLDELANLFSWRELPTVLADGGGIGIWTMVVLQALSQAETAWSRDEAQTIWSASIAKILLGGAGDASHLGDVEALLGMRERYTRTRTRTGDGSSLQTGVERVPVLSAAELRQLPIGSAVLTYRNMPGILLRLHRWIDRRDAEEIKAGIAKTEREQARGFGQPLPASEPGMDVLSKKTRSSRFRRVLRRPPAAAAAMTSKVATEGKTDHVR